MTGASAFPRHWVYDAEGRVALKSGLTDQKGWMAHSFGVRTPWSDHDRPSLVVEVESDLERQLSDEIMRGGEHPEVRSLPEGTELTRQGQPGDDLYLVLDGVVRVDVDEERSPSSAPAPSSGNAPCSRAAPAPPPSPRSHRSASPSPRSRASTSTPSAPSPSPTTARTSSAPSDHRRLSLSRPASWWGNGGGNSRRLSLSRPKVPVEPAALRRRPAQAGRRTAPRSRPLALLGPIPAPVSRRQTPPGWSRTNRPRRARPAVGVACTRPPRHCRSCAARRDARG